MTRLRILLVTPYVPSPLRVRPYNFVRQLSQRGHRVTVAAVCTPGEKEAAAALQGECERVETVPFHRGRALWNCIGRMPTGAPLQTLYTHSPALERLLEAELQTTHTGSGRHEPYDILHVEHLRAALMGLSVQGLPRVYDSVDCISRLLERASTLAASPVARLAARVDLNKTRRFEARLVRTFDCTLVTSEPDRQALAALADRTEVAPAPRITVVPNGVDLPYFQPSDVSREPATLVYLGRMSYHANVTAVLQFTHHVMPLIWAHRPDTQFVIVGADPMPAVHRLARRYGPRVVVTGYVSDTRPFLARATVSVSPLLYAVGIQNKILESMAMRTPVVATPAACSALRVESGTHLLTADNAAAFAHDVLRLFDDAGLRRRLAEHGRRYVERHHDWGAIGGLLEDSYFDAVTRFRARRTST